MQSIFARLQMALSRRNKMSIVADNNAALKPVVIGKETQVSPSGLRIMEIPEAFILECSLHTETILPIDARAQVTMNGEIYESTSLYGAHITSLKDWQIDPADLISKLDGYVRHLPPEIQALAHASNAQVQPGSLLFTMNFAVPTQTLMQQNFTQQADGTWRVTPFDDINALVLWPYAGRYRRGLICDEIEPILFSLLGQNSHTISDTVVASALKSKGIFTDTVGVWKERRVLFAERNTSLQSLADILAALTLTFEFNAAGKKHLLSYIVHGWQWGERQPDKGALIDTLKLHFNRNHKGEMHE